MSDTDIPPPPDTKPAAAHAIDRLASEVAQLRADIATKVDDGFARVQRELQSIYGAFSRLEANVKLIQQDQVSQKTRLTAAEERIDRLEAHAFREASKPKKRKRRAAKSR